MTYAPEHTIACPRLNRAAPGRRIGATPRRPRCRDARWPLVVATLAALRASKRCSVRIVDADCGSGTLLLCAVRFARALGFTAIEGRGVDVAATLVNRASARAAAICDPAIGITFERGEPVAALRGESDFPADIVLWHGGKGANAACTERAAARAGHALIADYPPCRHIAA